MSRTTKSSLLFTADTIVTKPLWLQRQLAPFLNPEAATPPAAPITLPAPQKGRVPRTRNASTITEAAYWGMLRSGLRRLFRFWKPAVIALHSARVACRGPNGQKWAYVCSLCAKPFPRKRVEIHHVVAVGKLLSYEDVGEFVRRLTPENPKGYRVLCKACHLKLTNSERTP